MVEDRSPARMCLRAGVLGAALPLLVACGPSPLAPELPGYSANGLERGAGAAAEPGPVSVGAVGTGPAGSVSNWGPTSLGPAAIGPGTAGPGPIGAGAVGGYNAY